MNKPAPVIAAIPNYNMARQLERLLPQLSKQDYAAIYVLDDASTDDSQVVTAQFAPRVKFVASQRNGGAAAARNQLLPLLGKLPPDTIIHFIDADTELLSDKVTEKAQMAMRDPQTGFVGGLITSTDGDQLIWNYGPRKCLYTLLTAWLQSMTGGRHGRLWRSALSLWPDLSTPPRRCATDWATEGNLLISSSTFCQLGGFDASLREHEIQDLALRTIRLGLQNYFDQSIVVRHLGTSVRPKTRCLARFRSNLHIKQNYTIRQWLLPGGHFKPQQPKTAP